MNDSLKHQEKNKRAKEIKGQRFSSLFFFSPSLLCQMQSDFKSSFSSLPFLGSFSLLLILLLILVSLIPKVAKLVVVPQRPEEGR